MLVSFGRNRKNPNRMLELLISKLPSFKPLPFVSDERISFDGWLISTLRRKGKNSQLKTQKSVERTRIIAVERQNQ